MLMSGEATFLRSLTKTPPLMRKTSMRLCRMLTLMKNLKARALCQAEQLNIIKLIIKVMQLCQS